MNGGFSTLFSAYVIGQLSLPALQVFLPSASFSNLLRDQGFRE